MSKLKVGDHVIWRGGFGCDPARPAKVESMELCERPHTKHGEPVEEADWNDKNRLIVTLTNGHWAYGDQLSPMYA